MEYMEYIITNENTLTVSFKFKNKITGADTMFNYEVSFEVFIEAVKDYFDKHFDVVLDGKDKDVWNMLVDLGERVNADIIQEFIEDDEIIKELQDKLEEEAHKKFDEICEEEAEDQEDDKLDESYEDDEVTDDEISEALADYQWQITDSTTVGQYAQETADKLGCSKEQVLKVILNENPNIREDEKMAKVAGLDDEDDYYEDEDFEYPDSSEVYNFGIYFIDEDGDELYSVEDGGYEYEKYYSTQEEAVEAAKNILKDPKVKNDAEIAGCHVGIIPMPGYDPDDGPEAQDIWDSMVPDFDPYEVTDVIWKSELN